jgi:peptide/nickel transport system permease protein
MKNYIARRLLLAIPTLVGVSLIIFFIMAVMPGDVAIAILGEGANSETVAIMREQLGLNDPWYERYGRWVRDMVTFGDLGNSIFMIGTPIKDLIAEHFPVTLNLAVYTMIISVLLAVPLGTISAVRHNTWVDYGARVFSIVGLSLPVFWLGMMIMLILVRWFSWTPELGWVSPFEDPWANFKLMVWPSVTLAYFLVAFMARMTRSSLLEVMFEDYMRTARAKGLRERVVVIRHGLRNAIIPIITIGGLLFVALLGGVVLTEKVFNLAGWGTLLVNGVFNRDYPLVQTMIFIFAGIVIVANLATDILYAWLDPRIRYQ